MLALRLPPDIEERLSVLAKKTGRTKSFYAREAIMEYLEDMEDYYLAKHRIDNPPDRYWTLEELEQEVDLEG